jgi:hypothetical protein
MKYLLCTCLGLAAATVGLFAQHTTAERITSFAPAYTLVAPLWYLASDALRGRGYGTPELDMAAAYIATCFKKAGIKPVAGASGYYQPFNSVTLTPVIGAHAAIDTISLTTGENAIQFNYTDVKLDVPLLYAGDATALATAQINVKGKALAITFGKDATRQKIAEALYALQEQLDQKGAAAIVAIIANGNAAWPRLKSGATRMHVQNPLHTSKLPVLLMQLPEGVEKQVETAARFRANISGTVVKTAHIKNVLGYVAGTDPVLRKQYIMLSSHYDHLGVGKPQMEERKLDSIYNGARDNATGTTAVIDAARYFAKHPPKRSIVFVTYTAEEQGLIGSWYYSKHPLLPLNTIVYNLNIDNASYNDTSLITLVALGRTTADSMITQAVAAYGMRVGNDPTGGQLFSGSDNYPLALKGVPAPTFSLGMKTFDSSITNRYHRLSDEPGNMNMAYVCKFIRAYILAASSIADAPQAPRWTGGDVQEAAWKVLYKKE